MKDIVVKPPLRLEIYWRGGVIAKAVLGWAGTHAEGYSLLHSRYSLTVARFLQNYFFEAEENLLEAPLDWERVQETAGQVLSMLQKNVSYGEWISYSALAEMCGLPNCSRAVGQIMRNNPWPLLVPCHRVLRKNGQIGGFSSGEELKLFLLQTEGLI